MRILRRRLPVGMAAMLCCARQVVVVHRSLSEAGTLAAVAIAIERCDGLFGIVMLAELKRVARMVA